MKTLTVEQRLAAAVEEYRRAVDAKEHDRNSFTINNFYRANRMVTELEREARIARTASKG